VERTIQILLADERDRGWDLLDLLRRHYAVHVAYDDDHLLQLADQARAEGRVYDLALIVEDPPLLGNRQTFARLRVLAPTTILVPMAAPQGPVPPGLGYAQSHDPQAVLALITDLLAERLAAVARMRTALMRPLAEISAALLQQPDLLRGLRALYAILTNQTAADYLTLLFYDRRREQLRCLLVYDDGLYATGASRPLGRAPGLAEWVITHDTPLISGDFPAEAGRRGWPAGEPDHPETPAAALVLPLHLGGQVIGAFAALSDRPGAFAEEDIALFGFVADLLAGVVAQWWTDLQWQRQSDLLADFDKTLATGGDRATILAAAAAAARQLTRMDAALIGAPPADGPAERYLVPPGALAEQFQEPLATLTAQLVAPAGRRGPLEYERIRAILADLGARGVGRVVSAPLGPGRQNDAMLWLLHAAERPFDMHDRAALAAVVRRTRLALAAAPAAGPDRRLLSLPLALQQAAVTAADGAGFLARLVAQARSTTGAISGAIFLREAGDRLVLRGVDPPGTGGAWPAAAMDAAGQALRTGQAIYPAGAAGSWACVPVIVAAPPGEAAAPLGVIILTGPPAGGFPPADRSLLTYLGSLAGGLIAGRQTQDATRAIRNLAGLPLSTLQLLAPIPSLLCRTLAAPVGLVHIWDRARDCLVLEAAAGLDARHDGLAALDVPGDTPALAALFALGPEADGGTVRAPLWSPAQLEPAGLRFGLAAPLWVADRPFGVLSVHTRDGRRLVPGAAQILTTLAADLGVGLEGRYMAHRVDVLSRACSDLVPAGGPAAELIAAPPTAPVAAQLERLLRSALAVTAARAAYLLLRAAPPARVILAARVGSPAAALTPDLPPGAHQLLELTSRRYLPDLPLLRLRAHPVFDPLTRSSLVLPLRPAGALAGPRATLGVLILESPLPQAVSEDDFPVIDALGALATTLLTAPADGG